MQTIDAVYEKGVFRPKQPLSIREGEEVKLTFVSRRKSSHASLSDAEFTALASEEALARIWDDPAEDEAWAHL